MENQTTKYKVVVPGNDEYYLEVPQSHKVQIHEVTGQIMIVTIEGVIAVTPSNAIFILQKN